MLKRREFMKALSFAGLGVTGLGLSRTARAEPYTGLYWVMVNAGGGWDPTSFCDPKGRRDTTETDPMNMYLSADIRQAGNIRYAPVAGNQVFFEKHYQKILVINGVDTATNGHDSGSRHTWSGRLAEGYPALPALLAGAAGPSLPLSFISNGGFDLTQGLVAPTRTGNTGALARIAFPNRVDPNNAEGLYHTGATMSRIQAAQRARMERRLAVQTLPRFRQAMSELNVVRTGENEIRKLIEHLPALDNSNNPLRRQAQLSIAAYKAGVSASANLSIGGFDTHGNHDQNHFPRLQQLTDGIDFLLTEAERQGVLDKLVVVVGSDFGRTPGYNSQNGKDHWSITSMLLMGAGIQGNRVIGQTDERHRPILINPSTLQPDSGGIRLTPGHVHRALRKLAGIDNTAVAQNFPITDAELQLLVA